VSFVLHDVFEIPFDAIASILGRSTAATKMLASRARGRIRLGTPATAADAAAREVVDAFVAAVGQGNLAGLLAVLAPEVELRASGPQGTVVVRGANRVDPVPVVDGLMAATALVHGWTLVTHNIADVAATGVRLLDPSRSAPS
jgi:hypothetical protein